MFRLILYALSCSSFVWAATEAVSYSHHCRLYLEQLTKEDYYPSPQLHSEWVDPKRLGPEQRKTVFREILVNRPEQNVSSYMLDVLLGIDQVTVRDKVAPHIKDKIRFGKEWIWQGEKAPFVPSTEYFLFHQMIEGLPLKPGQTVVDIGMAFGRLGFYLGVMRPEIHFKGYEIVPERVEESNRVHQYLGLPPTIEFHAQDLSKNDFVLPDADVYFAYYPVNEETGAKLWNDLIQKADSGKKFIFVGMMEGIPDEDVHGNGSLFLTGDHALRAESGLGNSNFEVLRFHVNR